MMPRKFMALYHETNLEYDGAVACEIINHPRRHALSCPGFIEVLTPIHRPMSMRYEYLLYCKPLASWNIVIRRQTSPKPVRSLRRIAALKIADSATWVWPLFCVRRSSACDVCDVTTNQTATSVTPRPIRLPHVTQESTARTHVSTRTVVCIFTHDVTSVQRFEFASRHWLWHQLEHLFLLTQSLMT